MRRIGLALLVLGLASGWAMLLGAAPPAASQGVAPLRLNAFRLNGALVAAQANGFLAAEGLAVDVTITPNSTAQMRGLGEGTWDAAETAFDNVLAWSGREGAEMVAVAQLETTPSLPVYARPEYADWQSLRGQPLAVDAVDTAFALVLRRLLLDHGLDLERGDYMLVPEGATEARFQSLVSGQTAAGILGPPWDARADAAGLVRLGDQR